MGKQSLKKNTNFIDLAAFLSVMEANDAEFRAFAALPEIGGEDLGRWFCAGSPALKEIINLLTRHQKKKWIISNPFNPSTKRIMDVKVKKVSQYEARRKCNQ